MTYQYMPSGELQGDTKAMPDRGTATGVTDSYGADLGQGADNRMGSITGDTGSDEMFENMPDEPTMGSDAADKAEDRKEGY